MRMERRLRFAAPARNGGYERFEQRRSVRLPRPPSVWLPSETGIGDWVVTLSSPTLNWVSSLGAARAKTADGNQLREAQRLGASPGPSPAPADPVKGEDEGALAPFPLLQPGPGPWHVRRA